MTENIDIQRHRAVRLMADAVVTFGVLVLAYLAFDDITTDNSTDFTAEYVMLAASAMWIAVLSLRLLRIRHAKLGIASLLFLVAAMWGQRRVGQGTTPSFDPRYVAVIVAFGWTLILAIVLLRRGWALHSERKPDPQT